MLEIKSCTVVCQEKNSVTRGWEKNSYPNQINHTHPSPPNPNPPSKVKWSANDYKPLKD